MKFRKLFVLCLLVAFSFLVACGGKGEKTPVHEHTYEEKWSNDATNHWHNASCEHSGEVSFKEAHKLVEETVAPTCEAKGTKKSTCSVCGYTKTEEIAATGHSWVHAECETPKTCSVCSKTEGEPLGHTWVDATCETPKTCSVCNKTEGDLAEHSWVAADCETPKTCSVCNKTEGDLAEHSWVAADCETPKTCSVCEKTEGEALGHSWVDATYDDPKTCSVCSKTEGEPLERPTLYFEFPKLAEFKTPAAYASNASNKWEYQASVDGNVAYFYVIQYFGSDVEYGENVDLSANHIYIVSSIGKFILCSNGALEVKNATDAVNVDYYANIENKNKTEYYLRVELQTELESDLTVNFYSYDSLKKNTYNSSDVCSVKNNITYHTHVFDKLYVGDKIKFKSETLYETPLNNQSPIPEKWGYHMQSANEGIYIYVYQIVDKVVYSTDVNFQTTHIEFSIFHHSFGFGADVGYIAETYVAAWPNGYYYINNSRNVIAIDLESTTVTDNKIEYRLFIRFNNNFDNPSDGPYSFIKVRTYDPKDNQLPYSDNDVVEYRDNRFLHTIPGNSLFVYEKVSKIDNPFETDYLASRLNTWNNGEFANVNDMTLFIGDSFFESDNWWTNFYTDYANKACFTSAIGGTKVTQWLNWIPSLVNPFAGNIKNIVIHLGYNDVNSTQVTAEQLEVLLEDLFARLHEAYPNANLYYFGIGTSYWFVTSGNNTAKETDELTKAFAQTCSYVTFVDMDSCYKKFIQETNGTLESFFKDATHPKNENYKYLMDALEEAGCVIADKN